MTEMTEMTEMTGINVLPLIKNKPQYKYVIYKNRTEFNTMKVLKHGDGIYTIDENEALVYITNIRIGTRKVWTDNTTGDRWEMLLLKAEDESI